jgi:hypothetical protein
MVLTCRFALVRQKKNREKHEKSENYFIVTDSKPYAASMT